MNKGYEVIFGTGPLGLAVMEELIKDNKNIILVNRSSKFSTPKNVQLVQCDALNKNSVMNVCQNANTIYHCLGLPYNQWKEKFPIVMDNIIAAAAHTGAKIVYGDNLYAYGPQKGPLHENLEYNPVGDKTKVRAEVATKLMEAHNNGNVIATIGRASDFYGPQVKNAVLGERVFKNLLESKKVDLLGNPNVKHSHLFIQDFAKGLVKLGKEDRANGQIWHIPHEEAKTNLELVKMIADQLGVDPKFRIANKFIVSVGSMFSPFMKELKELMYQHTNVFIVDSTKYQKAFGSSYTPYKDGIEKTISWYKDSI